MRRARIRERITGLNAVVSLPLLGATLRLADLHARLDRPRPVLVEENEVG